MPYIYESRREKLKQGLDAIVEALAKMESDKDPNNKELSPVCAGDLNYIFTHICHEYIKLKGGLNYQLLNDISGALNNADKELYRVVAAPYEDIKRQQNGKVSDLES